MPRRSSRVFAELAAEYDEPDVSNLSDEEIETRVRTRYAQSLDVDVVCGHLLAVLHQRRPRRPLTDICEVTAVPRRNVYRWMHPFKGRRLT